MTKSTLLGWTGLVLIAGSSPAFAQNMDAADGDVITVTAQKREQSVTEVPLAVQAITGEELEGAGIQDVAGLVSQIPSASLVSAVSRGFETIQIRGVSAGTTGDGLTGYYVDDFAFGIPNLQLSPPARLLDLQQVEVIRGPSGTIWGQGSMGGNIRLITADPNFDGVSGSVVGEYSFTDGGGNNYAVEGVLNLPLIEDKLAVRISGSYDELSGFADLYPTGEEDVNDSSGSNVRIKTLFTPTDRFKAVATVWLIDNDQDYSNNLIESDPFTGVAFDELTLNGSGSATNGPNPGFVNTSMDIYALSLTYDFDNFSAVSSTSYTDHELDFEGNLSILGFNAVNDSTFETESFSQELRFASTGSGPFQWIGGAYYRDATIDSDIDFFLDLTDLALGESPVIDQAAPLTTTSWSIFGEASYELFDGRLVPLVGLRYFEDDRSGGPAINRTTGVVDPKQSDTFTQLSPRFNVRYQMTDNANVFVNVAQGFRSGTLQTTDQAAAATALGVPSTTGVDADSLWTYELGTKAQLADGAVLFESSIYRTDWSDVQQPFGPLSSVANVGDAEITGFDVLASWITPLEGLSLRGSLNLQDTEWTSVEPNITLSLPFVAVGEGLLNVPDQTYTLGALYETRTEALGGGDIRLNANYSYTSQSLQQVGTNSDAISLLALRAEFETDGGVTVALFGTNLANEDGAVTRGVGDGGVFNTVYPRQIGVRVGASF